MSSRDDTETSSGSTGSVKPVTPAWRRRPPTQVPLDAVPFSMTRWSLKKLPTMIFANSSLALSESGTRSVSNSLRALSCALLIALFGCGDSGGDSPSTAPVTFGVSDAPVENLLSVVITIDRIILNRSGHDDVIIDRFTNEDLGIFDEDTVALVQGNMQKVKGTVGKAEEFAILKKHRDLRVQLVRAQRLEEEKKEEARRKRVVMRAKEISVGHDVPVRNV